MRAHSCVFFLCTAGCYRTLPYLSLQQYKNHIRFIRKGHIFFLEWGCKGYEKEWEGETTLTFMSEWMVINECCTKRHSDTFLFLLTFSDALKAAGSFALNREHIKIRSFKFFFFSSKYTLSSSSFIKDANCPDPD